MDFNQVKELINIIDSSTLVDFSIEFENSRINMSKSAVSQSQDKTVVQSAEKPVQEYAAKAESNDEPKTIIPESTLVKREGNVIESPLVGTFYESASPDKPAFVKVGSKVKEGDVLCIVEAMKIMNEITSKFDGTVTEILVKNQDMVEYGQHLYIIA